MRGLDPDPFQNTFCFMPISVLQAVEVSHTKPVLEKLLYKDRLQHGRQGYIWNIRHNCQGSGTIANLL